MPHILRDINPITATLLTQHHFFYDRAIVIVSSHSNLASQDHERLILRWVFMDGYHSPWLHRIQKPMTLLFQRLMKVIVHAQTGRSLRLGRNLIQQCTINNLHMFLLTKLHETNSRSLREVIQFSFMLCREAVNHAPAKLRLKRQPHTNQYPGRNANQKPVKTPSNHSPARPPQRHRPQRGQNR